MSDTGKMLRRVALSASLPVTLLVAGTACAQDIGKEHGPYVAVFGGIADVGAQDVRQRGEAYRRSSAELPGLRDFDLSVDVAGRTHATRDPVIGVQGGYRFKTRSRLVASLEVKGLYLSSQRRSILANATDEIVTIVGTGLGQDALADPRPLIAAEYGAGRHRFDDTMRMRTAMVMANAVVGYHLHHLHRRL